MAITDKEKGVWGLDQVYNKINQGSIWAYSSNLKNLWGWGDNGRGQLGQNNETEYSSPVQVGSDATWETLSKASGSEAGWIYARKNDSTLWAIGRNNYGILGQNESSNSHRSSPVQIPGNYDGNILSSGSRFTLFSKTEGTLWGVGSNQYGNLGQNSRTPPPSGISSPVQIPGTNWSQAVGGYLASFALKSDGTYWAWGNNAYGYGQLGQTDGSQNFSSPVQVGSDTTWSKIPHSIGGSMAAGIRTDGTLWVWGQGGAYLNKNVSTPYSSPIQIPGTTWESISIGGMFAVARKTDATLWAWGDNEWGQLGQNTRSANGFSSPVQIPGSWSTNYTTKRYGGLAIKTDGTLWSWGYGNVAGSHGLNNRTAYSSPTQIPGVWDQVSGGSRNGFALELK